MALSGERLNGSWPWVAFATAATGEAGAVGDAADPCGQESRREAAAFNVTGEFTADEEYSGIITVQARQDGTPSSAAAGAAARDQAYHHLCILSHGRWASVGPDRLRVNVESGLPRDYIPAWGLAVLVVALVAACGVLRTVNLSLLWLDPLELYVLHSCGSEEEKRSAKRLEPIRRRGNFLVRLRRNINNNFYHADSKNVNVHPSTHLSVCPPCRCVPWCSCAPWATRFWGC